MSLDKNTVIKYRIERAHETIDEAKILADTDHWNTVANRLYYACFYITIALLLKDGFITKTHNGVRTLLNNNYTKKGIISDESNWTFGTLFNKRQESDYKDVKRLTKEEIEPLIIEAEKFIEEIKKLIEA